MQSRLNLHSAQGARDACLGFGLRATRAHSRPTASNRSCIRPRSLAASRDPESCSPCYLQQGGSPPRHGSPRAAPAMVRRSLQPGCSRGPVRLALPIFARTCPSRSRMNREPEHIHAITTTTCRKPPKASPPKICMQHRHDVLSSSVSPKKIEISMGNAVAPLSTRRSTSHSALANGRWASLPRVAARSGEVGSSLKRQQSVRSNAY
ncbi:hypothetical protein H4582DRAFT_1098175 [Lactarius indigo]|nr:hypothetical protein H4582DRAFT_1098175 [Lactarius indigo]